MIQNTYEQMPSQMALSQPETLTQPLKMAAATLLFIAASAMIFAGIWELFLIIEFFTGTHSYVSHQWGHRSAFVDSDGVAASTVRLLGFLFFAIAILTCVGVLTFGGNQSNRKESQGRDFTGHTSQPAHRQIPLEGGHHQHALAQHALVSSIDEPQQQYRYSM